MRRLLVVNPNTTAAITALLQRHVAASVGPGAEVRSVTARFGASYIVDETTFAVGAEAALDAWAAALAEPLPAPDAVLIGCFGDPGLPALRARSGVPVSGLAEASFTEAARHGSFAVVTGGAAWGPMLQRLARDLGFGDTLAGIHTVAATGAQLAADPEAALVLLEEACRDAALRFNACAVIVGGAGLAGIAAALQPRFDVPLIDSVAAGARWFAAATPACAGP